MRGAALVALVIALAACDSGPLAGVAGPVAPTATPRSKPLPTVATQEPYGTEARPFIMAIVPPRGSDTSAREMNSFLNDQTGHYFAVNIVQSNPEALAALCGQVPAFAWVDGWTLLIAQARGCGRPLLQISRGRGGQARSGVRIQLIASAEARITAVSGVKDREFCRVENEDLTSWILPSIVLRGAGNLDPVLDLKNVRIVADTLQLLREVASNRCVGAIEAGRLVEYRLPGVSDITRAITILPNSTTPLVPYGGLVVSAQVPAPIAEQVTKLFLDNVDKLSGLVEADVLVRTSSADFAQIIQFAQIGKLNLGTFGQ